MANHRRLCKDCKVIPTEYLGTQHRLVVMDLMIKSFKGKKRSEGVARIRWWNVTRESATELTEKMLMQCGKEWLNTFEGKLRRF